MLRSVSDVRANLNENIIHAADVIGKSEDRRKVFEAVYRGKRPVKTVDDIVKATGLKSIRVLQEGGKLHANHIVEKTKKDGQMAYRKYEIYSDHKARVLSILDKPAKAKKYPTKQRPQLSGTTYKIEIPGKAPKIKAISIDDIDSFNEVRRFPNIDVRLQVESMLESKLKTGLKGIIHETQTFKDWGGEKNDLYTNKIKYKGKRRSAAFALKGRATKGVLTPKKMGKNGDQIARLVGSAAEMFFVVYHGKIDESVTSQLQAFALAKSMSGTTIYYCVIDGDDLNRLVQAYKKFF